jgi:predicted ArsR family transcriptional regulator
VKVQGYTISELSKLLEIKPVTVRQRLLVAGIKPLVAEYIYPVDTLEKLKKSPGRGRPKKQQ